MIMTISTSGTSLSASSASLYASTFTHFPFNILYISSIMLGWQRDEIEVGDDEPGECHLFSVFMIIFA